MTPFGSIILEFYITCSWLCNMMSPKYEKSIKQRIVMNGDLLSIIETAGGKNGSNEVIYQRLLEQNHPEGRINNRIILEFFKQSKH